MDKRPSTVVTQMRRALLEDHIKGLSRVIRTLWYIMHVCSKTRGRVPWKSAPLAWGYVIVDLWAWINLWARVNMDLLPLKKITKTASIVVFKISRIVFLTLFRGVSKATIVGCKPHEDNNCIFTTFIVFLLYRVPRVSHRHWESPVYKAQL